MLVHLLLAKINRASSRIGITVTMAKGVPPHRTETAVGHAGDDGGGKRIFGEVSDHGGSSGVGRGDDDAKEGLGIVEALFEGAQVSVCVVNTGISEYCQKRHTPWGDLFCDLALIRDQVSVSNGDSKVRLPRKVQAEGENGVGTVLE
jgi:hypothetical protein